MNAETKPCITPEQIAALEKFREDVQKLMQPIKSEKGGAAAVLILLSVTPDGRPEVTIDSNCVNKEEIATVIHLGRLLVPMVQGQPRDLQEAGAMMAGRDPFTGGRMIKGGGLIITDSDTRT